jgi:hypothetical protein
MQSPLARIPVAGLKDFQQWLGASGILCVVPLNVFLRGS